MLMNLSSMKYVEMRKHQNNDFKRCQDFEDMGKIRCLCQNGSRHKKVLSHSCPLLSDNKYEVHIKISNINSNPTSHKKALKTSCQCWLKKVLCICDF